MNRRGLVCITAGILLMLSAAGLTGYNIVDERQAGEKAEHAYELLRDRKSTRLNSSHP